MMCYDLRKLSSSVQVLDPSDVRLTKNRLSGRLHFLPLLILFQLLLAPSVQARFTPRAGLAADFTPQIACVLEVQFLKSIEYTKDTLGAAEKIVIPTWTSDGTKRDHVAYAGGKKMHVIVTFKVVTPLPKQLNNVTVQGQTLQGKLIKENVTIPVSGKFSVDITPTWTFRKQTLNYGHDAFPIFWTYTTKERPGESLPFGDTYHTLYVTLQEPLKNDTFYLTSIDLATRRGGASTEKDAFDRAWATFGSTGPANTYGWDDRILYYYQEGKSFKCAFELGALLKEDNGQCGTWAYLMQNVMAVNGIRTKFIRVLTITGTPFLVKDWTFAAKPAQIDGYDWKIKFAKVVGEMVPAPTPPNIYGDLTSLDTLFGQNTMPPSEKVFIQHFIVKREGVDCKTEDCYYDPSYGVTYKDAADFQSKAVAAYTNGKPDFTTKEELVRKPGSKVNIFFVVTP